jgi:hypothetical protein
MNERELETTIKALRTLAVRLETLRHMEKTELALPRSASLDVRRPGHHLGTSREEGASITGVG